MKRICILISVLFCCIVLHGQTPLPESRRSSAEIFVYRLDKKDLRKLHLKDNRPDESMLHTFVTSCTGMRDIPPLPRGNYMAVRVVDNGLQYTGHTVDSFYCEVVRGEEVRLLLTDTLGNILDNAVVKRGVKKLGFDKNTRTYNTGRIGDEKLVEVENDGVLHYIEFENHDYRYRGNFFRKSWQKIKYPFLRAFSPRYRRQHSKYDGFVVFSKPRYKPGETVKLKAYVHSKGKPYDGNMDVALAAYYPKVVDTVLANLRPYRPGMFEWEFKLSDSLKLTLDGHYDIELRTKGRNTTAISGGFRYEDYELARVTFSPETEKEIYVRGDTVRIAVKAEDENGMPVYDGSVETRITASAKERKYFANSVFIPDLIWEHRFDMEQLSERELTLPDSLFVAGVSMTYDIECIFTDASNERHTKTLSVYYDSRGRVIDFSIDKGIMTVRELAGGESVVTRAMLTAYSPEVETIRRDSVTLPYSFPLIWLASDYEVETATASGEYFVEDFTGELLDHRFYRDGEEIKLVVDNPSGIPFWYTVKKGGRVIENGYATELDYSRKDRGRNGYSMQLAYVLGENVRMQQKDLPYGEKNISMEVSTATSVWPGQTANVEVAVRDKKGRPVKNADVTAYAFTSKFGENSPNVSVYGKTVYSKGFSNRIYSADEDFIYNRKSRMDWKVWKQRMGLDSIEYYRFLYPETFYSYPEAAPGEVTQVSPYAVLNGNVQAAEIVWIDGQPYYFRQAEQLQVYSFPVTPGYHTITLRTYDREVTVTNVYAEEGMKTIFSFDCADQATYEVPGERKPVIVTVHEYDIKEWGKLTDRETALLKKHMITVENNFGKTGLPGNNLLSPPAVLNSGGIYYYLNDNAPTASYDYQTGRMQGRSILAGPFPYGGFRTGGKNIGTLYAGGDIVGNLEIEGGYNYSIWKDYLKQTSWGMSPFRNYIQHSDANISFKDHVLKPADIRARFNDKVFSSLRNLDWIIAGVNSDINDPCRLLLELGKTVEKPVMIHIGSPGPEKPVSNTFSGGARNLKNLPEGIAEVSLVFSDSTRQTVLTSLRKEGFNYLRIDSAGRLPVDSLTRTRFAELDRYTAPALPANPIAGFGLPPKTDDSEEAPIQTTGRFDPANYDGEIVTGTVRDVHGDPLIGAAVVVDGTDTGTITDIDGRFALPYRGPGEIYFTYLGYMSQTAGLISGYDYSIVLEEDSNMIDDVVVVGYGVSRKASLTGSVVNVSNYEGFVPMDELSGSVAGVMIRGMSTKSPGRGSSPVITQDQPLIIIDGVPYEGAMSDLKSEDIEDVSILKESDATGIYGARAAGGVIMIRTKGAIRSDGKTSGEDVLFAMSGANSIRTNFSDDAFWKPRLATDDKGMLSFEVTYPDDITNWTANFIAVGGRRKTDRTQLKVKSFKPLNAQLSVPSFMIAGDSLDVIGRLTNHTGDSLAVNRSMDVDGTVNVGKVRFGSSHTDRIPVVAESSDSIVVEYSLQMDNGYLDGERRHIPVFRQGVLETHGEFAVISDTAAYSFATDPRLGTVTVRAESSAMNVFLEEIEKIDRYQYMCNEQMASKVKALLMKRRICSVMGVKFRENRKIEGLISKLNRNRNEQNLWGWWNRDKTELWISHQIIGAMLEAEKEGFSTDFNRQATIDALTGELNRTLASDYRTKSNLLDILTLLHRLEAGIDYGQYHTLIASLPDASLNEKLRTAETALMLGTEPKPNADTITAMASRSLLGSIYWEEPRKEGTEPAIVWRPNNGNVENTLAAYRILRELGQSEQYLAGIRNYFFEQRKTGSWRNTYESSRILETIMPDMLSGGTAFVETRLTVNGRQYGEFPATAEFAAGTEVRASKLGTQPVFLSVYQQEWNEKPQAASQGFEIVTSFEKEGKPVEVLTAGEAVDLKVKVSVNSDAEYVMIEVPVPAGCSYVSKGIGDWRKETHREYYKEKVTIFCTRLSKGEHRFTIALNPRYPGSVHMNPARAELMYFPTVFGRNEMGRHDIGSSK